jgi:hypothetical protein
MEIIPANRLPVNCTVSRYVKKTTKMLARNGNILIFWKIFTDTSNNASRT